MKSIKHLLTVIVSAGLVSAASAQTTNPIVQADFDGGGNFNSAYGYVAVGSSAGNVAANFSGGLAEGIGVDGSAANAITADYTTLPTDPNWNSPGLAYVYAVLGNGTHFGAPITPITPTAVTGSFILEADLQVTGLLPSLTNADVTISKVQFLSGGTIVFDFSGDAGNIGSNFTHITIPLSALSYGGVNGGDATHPLSDLTNATVVDSIDNLVVEFTVQGLPIGSIGGNPLISPPFGFTAGGTLTVDNIQLLQTGNTIPTPIQEKLIWQADFDNTFPNGPLYGFSFRDGANGASGTEAINPTVGTSGSAALQYTVDLSSWRSSPPTGFSGFGVGGTESPLPFGLTSSDKASYRVYFSAKVGGVAAGASTNVPAVLDLLFEVPAGAETPSNAATAVVLDLVPNISLTTNWQSFVFDGAAMPVGVNNGGSQALFNQYVSKVNEIHVQVATQGAPDIGAQFGYGTNATIDIDNIKVVELVPGTPPVTVVKTNNVLKVFWTDPATGGIATLQSSTNAAGPFLNVSGADSAAASPFTVPAGSPKQFFRTVWVP